MKEHDHPSVTPIEKWCLSVGFILVTTMMLIKCFGG